MKSYPQLYEEIDSIGHGLYYPAILTYKELPHLEQRTTQLYQPEALGGSSQVVSIGPTRIGLFTFQKAYINGLEMEVYKTTCKSWDDPPKKVNLEEVVQKRRKPCSWMGAWRHRRG